MPTDIAEMIAALLMVFLIGTFVLLFPLSRRLGKVMEEWIQLRHDSSPASLSATCAIKRSA